MERIAGAAAYATHGVAVNAFGNIQGQGTIAAPPVTLNSCLADVGGLTERVASLVA